MSILSLVRRLTEVPVEKSAYESSFVPSRLVPLARRPVRVALAAISVMCIAVLTVLTAAGRSPSLVLELLLIVSFTLLALVDFRTSLAIAVFELALAGAGGRWAVHGSHLTGRIFLDLVVALAAVRITACDWRRGEARVLGRYGPHAIAIAILIPAIWMPLGLYYGHSLGFVIGDGNGYAFLAFAITVIVLVRHGLRSWFKSVFLAACAANAVVTGILVAISATRLVSLETMHTILVNRLSMGGIIGYMPNGAYRLSTGGSLFLLTGLALTAYELMREPKRTWPWLLWAILWADLLATYTRGIWLGGVVAAGLSVALGAPSFSRALKVVAASAAGFACVMALAPLTGSSLTHYVLNRAATIASSKTLNFPRWLHNPGFEHVGAWMRDDGDPGSLEMRRTVAKAQSGSDSLELIDTETRGDDYALQNLTVKPLTNYLLTAWVDSRGLDPQDGAHPGLFAWDARGGYTYDASLAYSAQGWRLLSVPFKTRARSRELQIRLYAGSGTVYWDSVKLISGRRAAQAQATGVVAYYIGPQVAIFSPESNGSDLAGQVSNEYRIEEAKALWHEIRHRPIFGSGFGAVAGDFGDSYTYELSYLDLLFKTGIVGFLLFLSFPLRLFGTALRARWRNEPAPGGGSRRKVSVVVAIISGIYLSGAVNPYLFASFGLISIIAMIAWLEPASERPESDSA
jgi:hypothetical protein